MSWLAAKEVHPGTFISSVSRDQVSQETTVIARTLHDINPADETLVTVWDGTYVYLHKSSNFEYQRVTYSGHKKKNYLKPMLVVGTNGLVVNVLGPSELWAGSVNDADILKNIMTLP